MGCLDADTFDEHRDSHSVFALQLDGSKTWSLPACTEISRTGEALRHQHTPNGRWSIDVMVEPGDTLFVPKGQPHRAVAVSERAMHLSIGVRPITWRALLTEQLQTSDMGIPWIDDPVHTPWTDDAGSLQPPSEWPQIFGDLGLTPGVAWSTYCRVAGRLLTLLDRELLGAFYSAGPLRPDLSPTTRIRFKPTLHIALERSGGVLTLSSPVRSISLNALLVDAVTGMLAPDGVALLDLQADLTEGAAHGLMRRLWDDGLVQICSDLAGTTGWLP